MLVKNVRSFYDIERPMSVLLKKVYTFEHSLHWTSVFEILVACLNMLENTRESFDDFSGKSSPSSLVSARTLAGRTLDKSVNTEDLLVVLQLRDFFF
jgi:hypothetical protein